MSPIALTDMNARGSFSDPKSPLGGIGVGILDRELSSRPSPWHDIAHSLSEAPSPSPSQAIPRSRRVSGPNTPGGPITPLSMESSEPPIDPIDQIDTGNTPPVLLSSSQALRDWERLLSLPSSEYKRHQLIHHHHHHHTPTPPFLSSRSSTASLTGGGGPKLEPERDKDGHIEYKLKLIDPSPERFERLVTQMMWRLKQGRNEAIYELGLADDGTVIGLTRAEMDASLRTLELMASEVGATVIILKEILLTGNPTNLPRKQSTSTSDLSSSIASSSASASVSASSSSTPLHNHPQAFNNNPWQIRRPDLDDDGFPRKGTRVIDPSLSRDTDMQSSLSRRERAKARYNALHDGSLGEVLHKEKQVIFDQEELEFATSHFGVDSPDFEGVVVLNGDILGSSEDIEIPPFQLDMDMDDGDDPVSIPPPLYPLKAGRPTDVTPGNPNYRGGEGMDHNVVENGGANTSTSKRAWRRRIKKLNSNGGNESNGLTLAHKVLTPEQLEEKKRKAKDKADRIMAKREQRRLDLIKGDGTNIIWKELSLQMEEMNLRDKPDLSNGFIEEDRTGASNSDFNAEEHKGNGNGNGHGHGHNDSITEGPNHLAHSPVIHRIPSLPHQAARPSSLRLATPISSPPIGTSPDSAEDNAFLHDLLQAPLDNLSLSFADVRSIKHPIPLITNAETGTSPSSSEETNPSTDTEYAHPLIPRDSHSQDDNPSVEMEMTNGNGSTRSTKYILPPPGEEMICVEVLVVRKSGGENWCGEDDVWGFGSGSGEDDGWGLGDGEGKED